MPSEMLAVIAAVSTTICLILWFRDVRRILCQRKSMVESAASQLSSCLQKAVLNDAPEVKAVLEQSEKIYRQAIDIYNQTICKPWNYLPALLMGFRPVNEADDRKERRTGL